jgi:hypothetical protein
VGHTLARATATARANARSAEAGEDLSCGPVGIDTVIARLWHDDQLRSRNRIGEAVGGGDDEGRGGAPRRMVVGTPIASSCGVGVETAATRRVS